MFKRDVLTTTSEEVKQILKDIIQHEKARHNRTSCKERNNDYKSKTLIITKIFTQTCCETQYLKYEVRGTLL